MSHKFIELYSCSSVQKLPYPKSVFFIMGNEFCERFSYYGMKVRFNTIGITSYTALFAVNPVSVPKEETSFDRGSGHRHLPHLLYVLLLHPHLWIHLGRHVTWKVQDHCLHLHHLRARPPAQDPRCCAYPGSASPVSSNQSFT